MWDIAGSCEWEYVSEGVASQTDIGILWTMNVS